MGSDSEQYAARNQNQFWLPFMVLGIFMTLPETFVGSFHHLVQNVVVIMSVFFLGILIFYEKHQFTDEYILRKTLMRWQAKLSILSNFSNILNLCNFAKN